MTLCFFFFNDTATTEIYTLSLHDALPIFARRTFLRRSLLWPSRKSWDLMWQWYWMMSCVIPPLTMKDRKSTRLNSSHANISYAVFCLKKKKEHMCSALLRLRFDPHYDHLI